MNCPSLVYGQAIIGEYMSKINHCLEQDPNVTPQYLPLPTHGPSTLQLQIKQSCQYVQTLKRNSHKIQQLILQNDRLRAEVNLQRKTIELHLKKQLELKYTISSLQDQLQLRDQQILLLETLNIKNTTKHQTNATQVMSQKDLFKLQEKLLNCIHENQILRQQNQNFNKNQFSKQQNYHIIEQQFKNNLNALSKEIQSLKADLHQQTEKTLLLQKIQTQNASLKSQNKRLQTITQTKLSQYDSQMKSLHQQLHRLKQGKEIFKEKYQQLTDLISTVDQMRLEFKTKKKTIQYTQQSFDLLQPIELSTNYPLLAKQKPIIKKSQPNFIKENLF